MKSPVSLGALASGIPFLFIGGKLLVVWMTPQFGGGYVWIKLGVSLALLEFILTHSGLFMGTSAVSTESRSKRIALFAGILVFYSVIAIGFSLLSGGVEVLQVFAFVMIGRFITIVSSSKEERVLLSMRAIIAVTVYFGLLFFTSMAGMPELGITREVARSIDWGNATGLWVRKPHIPIAMMAIYFIVMGVVEILFFGTGIARKTRWANSLASRTR